MKRLRFWPVTLLGVIGLMVISLTPAVTLAHPLDQFVLASYLTVMPDQIIVEVDMTPGALIAPQFLPTLDTNNDQQVSEAESQVYADAVLKNVALTVDAKPLQISFTRIEMPEYLNLQTGYGTMRLYAKADLPIALAGVGETHQIYYKNNYQPTNPTYQVNAFLDNTIPVKIGPQNRDGIQQSVTMNYTITSAAAGTSPAATPAGGASVAAGAGAGATNPAAAANANATAIQAQTQVATGNSDQLQQMFNFLYLPDLSPWLLVAALGLAVLLGGLHALTPGHGKTMVAAYLVGSRGTARHAIALGGIVTFTHTFSVIVIGLLALMASQFIVPTVLVPILESIAGILVISLGVRLIITRWRWVKTNGATTGNGGTHTHDGLHFHTHDHSGAASEAHSHDLTQNHVHADNHDHDHSHSHGGPHGHTHGSLPEKIRPGDLIAMGVSGGLVPCPEALGILVVAIGLNRIGLGLGLIVAFSLGVAVVLISIGLLLVRARTLLDRITSRGKGWQRWLPLVSAGIVTAIGMVMVFNGLKNYPLELALGSLVAVLAFGGIWCCLRLLRTDTGYPHSQSSFTPNLAQPTTSFPQPAKSGVNEKVS